MGIKNIKRKRGKEENRKRGKEEKGKREGRRGDGKE